MPAGKRCHRKPLRFVDMALNTELDPTFTHRVRSNFNQSWPLAKATPNSVTPGTLVAYVSHER